MTHSISLVDSDAGLVRQMARGDEGALRSLHALYGRRLFAYALRLTGDQSVAEEMVASGDEPEGQAEATDRRRVIGLALDQLSREHRSVLELVFWGGLSLAEVAQVSGCPVGTVKSRLSYAKSHLRAALEKAGMGAEELLGTIILDWLGPMTYLSSLALGPSMRTGSGGAVSVAFILWMARWMVREITIPVAVGTDPWMATRSLALTFESAWSSPALLLALAAGLLLLAFWMAGRQESLLSAAS